MSPSLSLSFPPPLAAPRAWFHRPTLILTLTRFTPLPHSPLRIDLRRRSRSSTAMSSVHRLQAPLLKPSEELADESDFETIVSSDGLVSICGFGSLLSGTIDQTALSSRSSLSHFVFWTLIVRSILFWRTREKREEYVSWSDQLQSCETQRFSASVRSRGSDFLWAWNSQARNQGSLQSLF